MLCMSRASGDTREQVVRTHSLFGPQKNAEITKIRFLCVLCVLSRQSLFGAFFVANVVLLGEALRRYPGWTGSIALSGTITIP
jgi:hypothetical protein